MEGVRVGGVEQGWWGVEGYAINVSSAVLRGDQPPLYFLVRELGDFWLAMHLHDWRTMLADGRVRLFIGEDAVEQFQRSVTAHPSIHCPRVSLSIGPTPWPPDTDLGSIVAAARAPLE